MSGNIDKNRQHEGRWPLGRAVTTMITQPRRKSITRRLYGAWLSYRGLTPPGNSVGVLADDTMIVSYPRSGNTWMRFLLANLSYPDETVSLTTVGRLVPDIYLDSAAEISRIPSPRLMKSHEPFDSRYQRVIYLVRDPRDVVVSNFHYCLRMGWVPKQTTLSSFLTRFLENGWPRYGTWGEHVGSWIGARGGGANNEDFLVVRYEDLTANPQTELIRMAEFTNLPSDAESVGRAVDQSVFERMRRDEELVSVAWQEQSAVNRDETFVRSGLVGEGAKRLRKSEIQSINSLWRRQMIWTGYLE